MRALRTALSRAFEGEVLAARSFGALLLVSGVGAIVAAWGDLWTTCGALDPTCERRSAAAGLLSIAAAFATAGGIAVLVQTRRRGERAHPVSALYPWGLAILMAGGFFLVWTRIPTWTCDVGRFDPTLRLCLKASSRTTPTSHLPLKVGILVLGLVAGAIVGSLPRWVRILAPATALVWLFGIGWVLLDTMVWR